MTTPVPQQQDDNDSLYDDQIHKTPKTTSQETVLPDEHAIHVDKVLDSEETPPASNSNSTSPIHSSNSAIQVLSDEPEPHLHDDDDDVFDSDENQISTSSSSSSSTTSVPESSSFDNIPVVSSSSLEYPRASKPAASFLSRASATFYKAFRKKKPLPAAPPRSHETHATLAQLFDAQIATLKSARTGFVDLALVRPMTQRTLEGVHDANHMLHDFGEIESKVASLRSRVQVGEREHEAEILEKEKLLVEAKVRLAQVSEEVDRLRHELRHVQKVLADPDRIDRRKVAHVRREALVCREARRDVERRLAEKKHELEKEEGRLHRVEKDYRDIEGEWE